MGEPLWHPASPMSLPQLIQSGWKSVMNNDIRSIVLKHLAYCRANEWAGIDPYDALNSKLLAKLPFLDSRLPRLAFTQALKRSPINIGRWLLTGRRKTQKPSRASCQGL